MPERPNSDRRRDSRGDSRSDSRGDFRTGGRSSTPRPASGTGRPPGPRPSRPAGARDDDRRGDSRGGDRDRAPRRDFGDRPSGDRDRAPRRDFGDRPSADRAPRREFGDRPGGDRRPSSDRPSGDRDRAPRRYGSDSRGDSRGGDRPTGDRRPGADRGPRREYGDRPVRRDDSRGDFRGGDRDRAPRREFGDRPTGDRAPRRDFGDRDRAPRRDFGDRPSGDRGPRREYGDRPVRRDDRSDSRGGDRDRAPRRDFGDRDRAPRREFGDRPARRDDSGSDSRGGDRDRAPRRYGAGAGRPSGPRRDDSRDARNRDDRRSGPRREDFAPRGPKNEAERRREAVRSRGGGEVRKDREQTPVSREAETWVDEGRVEDEVRDAAEGAVRRALAPRRTVSARPKDEDELDPQTKADVAKVLEPVRANRLSGRLKAAQIALERERYSEAKRIAKSLTKELSGVAAVHEVIGLASYRMGQWRDATAALELARSIRLHIEDMPVLADCYRAQRRWSDVDAVWAELKELSPSPEVMAEGRMVAAGSLSDRGELKDAIELMLKVAAIPRRVHEYHLKQWYVLGDLYDKAGNVQKAREFFQRVALHDKEYADVSERLASL